MSDEESEGTSQSKAKQSKAKQSKNTKGAFS
jgi:hypothetical protein